MTELTDGSVRTSHIDAVNEGEPKRGAALVSDGNGRFEWASLTDPLVSEMAIKHVVRSMVQTGELYVEDGNIQVVG